MNIFISDTHGSSGVFVFSQLQCFHSTRYKDAASLCEVYLLPFKASST